MPLLQAQLRRFSPGEAVTGALHYGTYSWEVRGTIYSDDGPQANSLWFTVEQRRVRYYDGQQPSPWADWEGPNPVWLPRFWVRLRAEPAAPEGSGQASSG